MPRTDRHYYDFTSSAQQLEIADVAVLLHHLQELDDDLGVRPDENLTLAALLGIHDVVPCLSRLRRLRLWEREGS